MDGVLGGGKLLAGPCQTGVDGAVTKVILTGGNAEISRAPMLVGAVLADAELAFHFHDRGVAQVAPRVNAHNLHDARQAHVQQSLQQRQAGSFTSTEISANSPRECRGSTKNSGDDTPSDQCLRQDSFSFWFWIARGAPLLSRGRFYIRIQLLANA